MFKGLGSVVGSILVTAGLTALTVLPSSDPSSLTADDAGQVVRTSDDLGGSSDGPHTSGPAGGEGPSTTILDGEGSGRVETESSTGGVTTSEQAGPRGGTETTSTDAAPAEQQESGASDPGPDGQSELTDVNPGPVPEGSNQTGDDAISFAVTGDVLIHSPVARAASTGTGYDFVPMFAQVAPLISAADVGICHMETPISADNNDLSGYPVFSAPHEIAQALAASGYDGCSTASNHSIDQGFDGVTATLDALEAAGLAHAGTARSQQESLGVTTYVVKGQRIAHLSYTYGTNGIPIPSEQPWSVQLIDANAIVRAASEVRQAGASAVIVSLHWGQEYQVDPTGEQERVAEALASSGAVDVIVGHHAHVVQPVEFIDDTLVIWGLGNLLSNQGAGCCSARSQDGVVISFRLVSVDGRLRPTGVLAHPTWVDRANGYKVVDIANSPAGSELCASWNRTVETMRDRSNVVEIPSSNCG